ncbi:MAG: polyphosphate kinase 1 [Acidobacteria bacterium]|nr:polyphosphate kinase 1 [Acidobacteriota bacterium]
MAKQKHHRAKHLFFNRDESWLRFNVRVLEEAQDESNPLLERLKFLAITASNLDEFVEIRVAGVLQRIEDGFVEKNEDVDDGLTEQERLDRLIDQTHAFVHQQYSCWTRQIQPALEQEKICIRPWDELSNAEREFALDFYEREVDPLLTPITIDPSHPFPRVLNKALCMALLLKRKRDAAKKSILGIVTVPRSLPRFIKLPGSDGEFYFLPLHELIAARTELMYPGYQILAKAPFRITRNSNLYLQEEESQSLLETVREELHNRRKGAVVRLEVEAGSDEQIIEQLRTNFELERWQVFRTAAPINLSRIFELYNAINKPTLKFPHYEGRPHILPPNAKDIFAELREHDILLHHPFDHYDTVESFVQTINTDDRVISVKQTLYRTASDSPAFESFAEAAPNKDITVVIELMARFDEDSNIRWARHLEEAGVQVFHGIVGRKTHCKLALIVRRDEDGAIRRYAHLGTGNYNHITACFYTDVSLLTANPEITGAVQHVFNYLTAESEEETFDPLLVAPINMAAQIIELIDREARNSIAGKPARIIAKMNALLDAETIKALYRASQAGVQIDLIVRGMCALRPGIAGLSDNIRVRSIVGRFLEHSRIFWFANGGGAGEMYAGSADWMPRNLHSRCEVVFSVIDKEAFHYLKDELLGAYLRDNVKARLLQPDGEYTRAERTKPVFSAQQFLMQEKSTSGPERTKNQATTRSTGRKGSRTAKVSNSALKRPTRPKAAHRASAEIRSASSKRSAITAAKKRSHT